MNLFAKTALAIIILILVAAVLFVLLRHIPPSSVTKQEAEAFVVNDLKQSNSNVNISIINVSPSTLAKGSWNVIVSLVYNNSRACPTVLIEGYDYPAMTLLSNVYDLYSSGNGASTCNIYGISSAPTYIISLPQIAVARTTIISPLASSYIDQFGYNNTFAKARYLPALNSSFTPLGENFSNVWLVNYTAAGANYSEYVVLSSSGGVLGAYSANK